MEGSTEREKYGAEASLGVREERVRGTPRLVRGRKAQVRRSFLCGCGVRVERLTFQRRLGVKLTG